MAMADPAASAQADVTLAQAAGLYQSATHNIRRRHDPQGWLPGEDWPTATRHVVAGMGDWEAAVILRYLATQADLPELDVMMAKALAVKLGLEIQFERKELVD
ncbi:MAG: hypothetical protein IT328_04430 [Caldilineaceae bacterium]|nr:hypothetical protein [Caldilineaceae bacterium]